MSKRLERGLFTGLALLAGCSGPALDDTRWRCTTQADCGDGFVCSTGLGACVQPDNSAPGVFADRIVVGMTGPLASGDTTIGRAMREGLEAYFNAVNADGGLDGRQVEVLALDDGGDPDTALAHVRRMVEEQTAFAFLGNVGTGPAEAIAPYLTDQRRLLLGALSGSADLRRDPPDRYVFNYRPGLGDEGAQGINYLLQIRDRPVPPDNVAVFAAGTDDAGATNASGQAAVQAVQDGLRSAGAPAGPVTVATHVSGTRNVDAAVGDMLRWLAAGRTKNANGNTVAAIALGTTAEPSAAFAKSLLDELSKIQSGFTQGEAFGLSAAEATQLLSVTDLTLFALSGVGVDALAEELASFGTYPTTAGPRSYCESVLATQVVPSLDSSASGLVAYRDHLRLLDPNLRPSTVSLEGYLVARLFAEAVIRNGPSLSTEGVVDALEGMSDLDFGVGNILGFGPSDHQAADDVFGARLTPACAFEAVDLGEPSDNPTPAPDGCDGGVCVLTGVITQDTRLTADKRYLLKGTVFVGDGANRTVLTVDPGTTVLGDKDTTGVLVIRRGAQIIARGTREAPIVFTSSQPVGQRASGDWGGVIINGRAPINQCGIEPEECAAFDVAFGEGGTGFYGGDDPEDDSGELRYVRVEFAGKLLSPENELNGLALQGVGRGTVLDYIQVHRGKDDGVEFFGGTVDFKHILVTGAQDDSIDWTQGWTGRGQFALVQQWPDDSDNGIEADNNEFGRDNLPRSQPVLSNVTLVGVPTSTRSDYGMLLREGTGAQIHNAVVLGFEDACVDIDHAETWAHAMTTNGSTTSASGGLVIANSVFACATPFEEEGDDPVRVSDFVMQMNAGNQLVGVEAAILTAPFDVVGLDMRPVAAGPAASGAVIPQDVFFEDVPYLGAVDPAGDWTAGWITNVEN